ncbi:hypothetical protein CVT26_011735 [Gymnopilus dilepis]|uniref:Nephrocystin 3-like N-terminal domain-containing protein n=1 Tax=Gymnopilus dilepis TaxID=231916 RepID=A0A409W5W2_9AGAR|nr:hypothetical protein CVT26_011735 [Gymnopilus dilepis]
MSNAPRTQHESSSKSTFRKKLRDFFHRGTRTDETAHANLSRTSSYSVTTPAASRPKEEYKDEAFIGFSRSEKASDSGQTPTPAERERRVGVALDVLSQVLKAATTATTFFPPAQAVVGVLNNAVETVQVNRRNEIDRNAVKRNLEEARRRLDQCKGPQTLSDELSDRILKLKNDLEADFGSVEDAMNERWWIKWTEGDAQELGKHYGRLSSMLSLFIAMLIGLAMSQTETVIDIHGQVELLSRMSRELAALANKNYDAISQLQVDEKFKQLNRASNVEYDAGPPDLRRSCTPETRKQILTDLMAWATDDMNFQVYWLSGMAGTGKTTIAYSFCDKLQTAGLLCTSFFCSRAVTTSTNPRDVLPSIAYHLAYYSHSFAKALYNALREPINANIRQKELEKQFDVLILGPAKLSSSSETSKRRVVIYDGSDEAADVREVAKLISLFLQHTRSLPFKLFISSRREDFITSEFEREALSTHSTALLLHDVEESLVEADIRLYICERLKHVPGSVAAGSIDTLVQRSGSLFVYAAVMCSYLEQTKTEEELQVRLQAVLGRLTEPIEGISSRPHDALDIIYAEILAGAAQKGSDVWAVLLVILTTQIPLSISTIKQVLGFKKYRVRNVVASLHAVLTTPADEDDPVTVFHASFRDFLNDSSRGKTYCDLLSMPHETLASRCLEIMKSELLEDDVCQVKRKDVIKADIAASKIRDSISAASEYSCTSWIHHLAVSGAKRVAVIEGDVLEFFDELILRWIECMSWLGKLEDAVKSLRRLEISQHHLIQQQVSAELRFAAMDARRLILLSFEAIRDFPLEVYHSALVWLPKASRISQRYQWQEWQISCGLPQTWDACESVLTNHTDFVQSVCFSHDGKKVISGSDDKTIRIWNVETGEEESRFKGLSDEVWCVATSLDGLKVVSGSKDNSIQIWNVKTGTAEKRLMGHTNCVTAVSMSHDGTKVISGSWDMTVRIWSTESGVEEKLLEGHTEVVWSVAISPDDLKLVSGSSDKTVRIWNVRTGRELRKLDGHSSYVRAVAISPDGRSVVSGSDDMTIRIWNIKTGQEERRFEGHSGWVRAVAVSRDGKKVISGSRDPDSTVRIWDIESGREERRFKGHTDTVRSVAISPDGRRVASGSLDSTVRIWGVELSSGPLFQDKVGGHSDCVRSLALSPEGAWVVTGSDDKTVRIWDVESGKEMKIFEGHLGWVVSVAVSPDARKVVSGSVDKTVRIWDVETGQVEKVLEGHSDAIRPVVFSRDGKRVAAGYWDDTLRIWTVRTEEVEVTRLAALNRLEFKPASSDTSEIVQSSGWLSFTQTGSRLWVPTSLQEPQTCADAARTVSFGYGNGDIFIIRYTGM